MKNLVLFIGVAALMIMAALIISYEAEASVDRTTNSSLSGGVVELDGRTYNCITYTAVDRGGLWCERISP